MYVYVVEYNYYDTTVLFCAEHPASDGITFWKHCSPEWQWLRHTSYQHSKPSKGL